MTDLLHAAPAQHTTPLDFALAGVSKSFGAHRVLNRLDFTVPPGSVVGLLGTNGAGKSTLLKCLIGLLRADAGAVTIDGHDAWDLPAATKSRIGYVDQTPRFYPWMHGKHLLPYVGSFYPDWDADLIDRLAAAWEVPMNRPFGKLSPGQQQKIALLAAVGHRPGLLILDEPVSALDPVARRAFLRALLELTADANRTVILSTHITSDIERVASHVAVLARGKMHCVDELDELKDRVKRLRITAPAPLDPGFTVPGALRCDVQGAVAVALVTHDPKTVAATLHEQDGFDVAIEDLNLEEIFIELTQQEEASHVR